MARNFITTHDEVGISIFLPQIPETRHEIQMPFGTIAILYASNSFPVDLQSDADIAQYNLDGPAASAPSRGLIPPNGIVSATTTFRPGADVPMHRTVSLDVQVVLQGELELHLDSGEVRRLRVGDSVVQRGTAHRWVNVTDGGKGEAKAIGFAAPAILPEVVDREGMESLSGLDDLRA